MMDDESSCLQMADLETECTNVLNAEYFSTKLKYALGITSPENRNIDVTLGDIYTFSGETQKYTK